MSNTTLNCFVVKVFLFTWHIVGTVFYVNKNTLTTKQFKVVFDITLPVFIIVCSATEVTHLRDICRVFRGS